MPHVGTYFILIQWGGFSRRDFMQSGGFSYRKSDLSFFHSRVSYSCYFAFTATPKLVLTGALRWKRT
ncbi:hypothetical protein PHYSODRAFT_358101 [Phytophthora sojae]|uniref:Uncharacterized protein n=1 Tax=Phytophthora sojae (strain P6497) TaxID=1094619 RepID=G5AIG8_PHYSP|nr:hypothetical protein PHYSODRAFT_358101 [Phytophthora sojae]EGZ04669.1 hypothetical protein PHYSODRAFT_358101 [Phytophthora sojae]|eukprot:XP_009539869.1 hypothetical protein PHYSODRAFT_358101 [Phytophthora sojae]